VIAVAVAVIMAVILLTGGVVAGSDVPGTLEFFGVTVRTTGAQIFLTGAICTWALLAAAWLLAAGIRRSRERGAELALLRGRAPSRMNDGGFAKLASLVDHRGALPEHGEGARRSEPSGRREFPGRSDFPGHRQLLGSGNVAGRGQLPGHSEIPGLGKHAGSGEIPGLAEIAGGSDIPGLGKCAGSGEIPGSAEIARGSEIPGWRKVAGSTKVRRRESLGRRELAGLLGFAVRPGRVVAEGSGSGSHGDRADSGQHPTK
jgi:hypothetical protein